MVKVPGNIFVFKKFRKPVKILACSANKSFSGQNLLFIKFRNIWKL